MSFLHILGGKEKKRDRTFRKKQQNSLPVFCLDKMVTITGTWGKADAKKGEGQETPWEPR